MKPIDEICRMIVEHYNHNTDLYGTDVSRLEMVPRDKELEDKLVEHLNISRTPKRGFYKRLTNALFEKYGTYK